ncbi:hypothetical protein BH18ACT13_BH18ACT13_12400 [soil metagenome]
MLSDTRRTILPIPSTQSNRAVLRNRNGVSVEYAREVPFAAMVCFWVATLLSSWMLVGLVVAGIFWLAT